MRTKVTMLLVCLALCSALSAQEGMKRETAVVSSEDEAFIISLKDGHYVLRLGGGKFGESALEYGLGRSAEDALGAVGRMRMQLAAFESTDSLAEKDSFGRTLTVDIRTLLGKKYMTLVLRDGDEPLCATLTGDALKEIEAELMRVTMPEVKLEER